MIPAGLPFVPQGDAIWLKDKLFQKKRLAEKMQQAPPEFDWQRRLLVSEHYLSHAASAFLAIPGGRTVGSCPKLKPLLGSVSRF